MYTFLSKVLIPQGEVHSCCVIEHFLIAMLGPKVGPLCSADYRNLSYFVSFLLVPCLMSSCTFWNLVRYLLLPCHVPSRALSVTLFRTFSHFVQYHLAPCLLLYCTLSRTFLYLVFYYLVPCLVPSCTLSSTILYLVPYLLVPCLLLSRTLSRTFLYLVSYPLILSLLAYLCHYKVDSCCVVDHCWTAMLSSKVG